MTTPTYCKVPGCLQLGGYARGLCLACYFSAARLVKEGKTSWETLQSSGKVDPVKTNHPQHRVVGRVAYFLGSVALIALVALTSSSCTRRVAVTSPALPPCISVVTDPGVDPVACQDIQRYYSAEQRCYAEHVDPAALKVPMSGVTINRVPATGKDSAGLPVFQTYDGAWVYGYTTVSVMGPYIAFNYPLVLVHEFGHYFGLALGRVDASVTGHGTPDDPLLGINCQEYLSK